MSSVLTAHLVVFAFIVCTILSLRNRLLCLYQLFTKYLLTVTEI